jgi:ribose transport system permease protein
MTGSGVQGPGLSTRRRALQELARSPVFTAVLALLLVLILGIIFPGPAPTEYGPGGEEIKGTAAFYKWGTHRDALRQASVFGILACGMTLVIITAGIDLSVGSVLALAAVCFSIFAIHWSWSPWLAIPAGLLIAAACGVVSGGLVARFAIQPFIVTLAMMVFARGLAKYVSGGMKISQSLVIEEQPVWLELPRIFSLIDSRLLGGNISVVTLIFFACVLVSWILLSRLRWGRYLYAIGGNESAARLSGVPVGAMKLLAYGLSGFFAGVAGICQAAQETQGDPEAGTAYELSAIAIVVIGGTSLMGGRGGIGLTLLGTLIIGYIDKILSINAVPEASRLMLTGAIIVVAVLLQRRRA